LGVRGHRATRATRILTARDCGRGWGAAIFIRTFRDAAERNL